MKTCRLIVGAALLLTLFGGAAQAQEESSIIESGSLTAEEEIADLQLGQSYVLDGYARITVTEYTLTDSFYQYEAGYAGNHEQLSNDYSGVSDYYGTYAHVQQMSSGSEAKFAMLRVKIENLQDKAVRYLDNLSVKVIYQEEYELGGWARQYNPDDEKTMLFWSDEVGHWTSDILQAALDPADQQAVDPLYAGEYVFGCTLPTMVLEEPALTYMVIELDGYELTYYIQR